jgi:hypothetical protein
MPGRERAARSRNYTHQQTFGNEQTDDARARGANRDSQRDLAPASTETNEQ